jgi:glyoxylase-like metal-dependent hydrolase (beta-lactamase superfamily II)/ferredoxin
VARADRRLAVNVPGSLFVDDSCIDCGTCRWVAPDSFARDAASGLSYVTRQPTDAASRRLGHMALVACPTSSIGTATPAEVPEAARAFPDDVGDGVLYCGYASEKSFGAAAWLVRRPEGNVLVDSPRLSTPLLDRIEALGGVRTLFLTHQDDVAEHEALRRRFGCERVLHEADVGPSTRGVERVLVGEERVRLAGDLLAVPVPGHTWGSAALLLRDDVLFTGDHLWGDEGRLDASRSVCWASWPAQVRSMERLLDLRFRRVLPGHGDPYASPSPEAMRSDLVALIARMKAA